MGHLIMRLLVTMVTLSAWSSCQESTLDKAPAVGSDDYSTPVYVIRMKSKSVLNDAKAKIFVAVKGTAGAIEKQELVNGKIGADKTVAMTMRGPKKLGVACTVKL